MFLTCHDYAEKLCQQQRIKFFSELQLVAMAMLVRIVMIWCGRRGASLFALSNYQSYFRVIGTLRSLQALVTATGLLRAAAIRPPIDVLSSSILNGGRDEWATTIEVC